MGIAKKLRSPGRLALIGSLAVALAGASTGVTFAAFTSSAQNAGNTITAAPDWTAPAIGAGGVGKQNGPIGFASDGDTVYMFMNVTETGNPASGIANVTASAYVAAYGQTIQFPMSAGNWNVRGQSFNYRSDAVDVPNGFGNQTLTVNVSATDNAGNSDTASFPVVFDTTQPTATNVQSANGGGTQSRLQQNDTLTLTTSEQLDAWNIVSGWDGTGTQNMTVRLVSGGNGNDTLQFYNAANNATIPLGTVNLGRSDYIANWQTVNFTGSTMTQSGGNITITLGTPSGAVTTAGGGANIVWTPSTAATDRAGNNMSNAPRTETTPPNNDRDF
jgi:hypothetical protein